MTLKIVPPKESITPRRKQLTYDFAVETFNYGSELISFRESEEFTILETKEQDLIIAELELIEKLNGIQVAQIDSY